MNSLNGGLKIIVPFLISILPALCKLMYGSKYNLLVDSISVGALWGIVIWLLLGKFFRKLLIATISIVFIFFVYILTMSTWLPFASRFLPLDDRYIGFSIIVLGAFFCCLLVLLIFRNEVKEYEKYFRLIADGITVIIAIIFLYDSYYGASEFVKILVLNKGFIGIPVIIYLVRFFVSACVLKDEEHKHKSKNGVILRGKRERKSTSRKNN